MKATSKVSLLKSDIRTSDINSFASRNISGNLFRVSSRFNAVSVEAVNTDIFGKTFEVDFGSAPRRTTAQKKQDVMSLSILLKGI